MEPIIYLTAAFFLFLLLIQTRIQKAEIKRLQSEVKLKKRKEIFLSLEMEDKEFIKSLQKSAEKISELTFQFKPKQWGEKEYEHYMKSKRQSFKSGGISFPVNFKDGKLESEYIHRQDLTNKDREFITEKMRKTQREAQDYFRNTQHLYE